MKGKENWKTLMSVMLVMVIAVSFIMVPGAMAQKDNTTMVNINTADIEKLTSLPSIGTSKANAIIQYRSEHGPFGTIDELLNVRGIGSNVFEKIRDLIIIQ